VIAVQTASQEEIIDVFLPLIILISSEEASREDDKKAAQQATTSAVSVSLANSKSGEIESGEVSEGS
jgi:hypothetical protein